MYQSRQRNNQNVSVCTFMPLSWYPIHSVLTKQPKWTEIKNIDIILVSCTMTKTTGSSESKRFLNVQLLWLAKTPSPEHFFVSLIFGLFSLLVHRTDTLILHFFELTYQTLKTKNKTKNRIEWNSAKFSVLQCYLIWSNVIEFFYFWISNQTHKTRNNRKNLNEILLERRKTHKDVEDRKWAKAKPNWFWVGFEFEFRLGFYFDSYTVWICMAKQKEKLDTAKRKQQQ